METLKQMMISLEQLIISLIGGLIIIIGFFISRTLRHFDLTLKKHDEKIEDHDIAISGLLQKISAIDTSFSINSEVIKEKLDYILEKMNQYDTSIKEFYQKYDLPLKK